MIESGLNKPLTEKNQTISMLTRYFSIIDRYVARELLQTWLAVSLVLMLILLSSTLARLLGQASEGLIPEDAVFTFMIIISVRYLILVVPLSLYLGVLLTFSRLYKDNEMAVLAACGFGISRFYRPLLIIVIPASLFMLVMTMWVIPDLSHKHKALQAEIESRSELSGLIAGRFNEAQDGNAIMFLEKQSDDRRSMENIFLHQKDVNVIDIETAARAHRYKDEEGRKFILFSHGQHYAGTPGTRDFRIIQYEKHGVYLDDDKVFDKRVTDRSALPTKMIWNSSDRYHQAEFQWRLSIPMATFLLAMLALPLSYTKPRKGRYSRLAPAIFIYLIFTNLLSVAQTWIENGTVSLTLGMWWVHGLLFLVIVFWLFIRAGGVRRFLFKPARLENT